MQLEQDPTGIRNEFRCKSQAEAFTGSSIKICTAVPGSAASSQGGLRCLNTVGKRIPRISNIFLKSQMSAGAVEPRCGGPFQLGMLLSTTQSDALSFPFQGFLLPSFLFLGPGSTPF